MRYVEYKTPFGFILSKEALLVELLFIMMDQRQGRKSTNQFVVFGTNDGHAVGNSIAPIVETLGGEVILAGTVDEFSRAYHEVPGVEETVDLDELLRVGDLGRFGKIGNQKLVLKLLR